jgi:hypothetical protein
MTTVLIILGIGLGLLVFGGLLHSCLGNPYEECDQEPVSDNPDLPEYQTPHNRTGDDSL